MMRYLDYGIILAYVLALLGIGYHFSKGEKNSENYLLGGRNMPFFAVGIACMMSLLSSVSLVMIPGEIYNYGLSYLILSTGLNFLLAIPCYLLFTRFYFRLGSFTPYEYLEYRYDVSIRVVVAVSAFYGRTMYLAMVLFSTSKIFEAAYNCPAYLSIVLVGGIGVIYTVMGGSKAVIWTDVLQFFVLVGGFVLMVVFLCWKIDGGALEAIRYTFAEGHGLKEFTRQDFYGISPYVRLLFWSLLWGAIIGPLTTACSDQITIQRLLSTRNWQEGLKSQVVSTLLAVPFSFLLFFVGMAIFTYYGQNPDPSVAQKGGDQALFHFIATQLPPPIPGIFVAAMLAAIMSTLSSGFNSMAAVWLKEFHQKFVRRELSPADEVAISQKATVWVGIFCIGFGILLNGSGEWLAQSASEVGTLFYLLGSAILPAFLFAVLSSRANSTLIWGYTAFAIGEGIAGNFWYILSRKAEQLFLGGVDSGPGWGGELSGIHVIWPLMIGLLLCAPYLSGSWRKLRSIRLTALAGIFFLGGAFGMLTWYCFSCYYANGTPLARSFSFGLPISFFASLIILFFCPKQAKEKYQGLTLATLGLPILCKRTFSPSPTKGK